MVDRPPQPADDDNAKAQERRRLVRRLAVVGACPRPGGLAAGLRALDSRWLYPSLTETDLRTVSDAAKIQELKGARLKLQNDARTTLLQGLGAVLVLTGAGIGASRDPSAGQGHRRATRSRATDAHTEPAESSSSSAEQGQVTDRYTRAVEQLGHEKAPVRLGALYSLEHLAQDNPEYRQTVVDVVLRLPAHALHPPSSDRAGRGAGGGDGAPRQWPGPSTASSAGTGPRPGGASGPPDRPAPPRRPPPLPSADLWSGGPAPPTLAPADLLAGHQPRPHRRHPRRLQLRAGVGHTGPVCRGDLPGRRRVRRGDLPGRRRVRRGDLPGRRLVRRGDLPGRRLVRRGDLPGRRLVRRGDLPGHRPVRRGDLPGRRRVRRGDLPGRTPGSAGRPSRATPGSAGRPSRARRFDGATFQGNAWFTRATFQGDRLVRRGRPSRATPGSTRRPSRTTPGSTRRPSRATPGSTGRTCCTSMTSTRIGCGRTDGPSAPTRPIPAAARWSLQSTRRSPSRRPPRPTPPITGNGSASSG